MNNPRVPRFQDIMQFFVKMGIYYPMESWNQLDRLATHSEKPITQNNFVQPVGKKQQEKWSKFYKFHVARTSRGRAVWICSLNGFAKKSIQSRWKKNCTVVSVWVIKFCGIEICAASHGEKPKWEYYCEVTIFTSAKEFYSLIENDILSSIMQKLLGQLLFMGTAFAHL